MDKTLRKFCFDLLQRIGGVVDDVYANSIPVLIDGEIPVRYISAEDLVKNKPASGRPQALADAAAVLQKQRAKRKAGR
jgi:hypothetical protein